MMVKASRFDSCVRVALLTAVVGAPTFAQSGSEPQKLLAEADRLEWLRPWIRAEPLYEQGRVAFVTVGDKRMRFMQR